MKEIKILKSSLKGRKKIVEALLIIFMISGSIQSFAADRFGSYGDDIINQNVNIAGSIVGDYSKTGMDLAGSDTITLGEGVSMSHYRDTIITVNYYGNIYGDYVEGGLNKAGDDIIVLEKNSKTNYIYGETIVGDLIKGGSDKIIIKGTVNNVIFGDFVKGGNLIEGGDDVVTVEEGGSTGNIYGDFVQSGNLEAGGDDVITIKNNASSSILIGDYAANGDIIKGGNDTITVSKGGSSNYISGDSVSSGDIIEGGSDTITVTDISTSSIQGDRGFNGNIQKGGNDKIYITDDSVIESVSGDYTANGDVENGGDDLIDIDDSTVDIVAGDYSFQNNSTVGGNIEKGGNDTINIDNSTFTIVTGEYAYQHHSYDGGVIEKGGEDTITISNSTVSDISIVAGEYVNEGYIEHGGKDTITILNSNINSSIYGEYTEDGDTYTGGNDEITIENLSTIKNSIYGEYAKGDITITGGNDTINIDNSTIEGSIYGEMASGTITTGGDDIFTLVGATIISGNISGGEDSNGTITGDYDTLNLSAYTTDFTTLHYFGVEEVNLKDNTAINLGDGTFISHESEIFNIESGSSIKADNGDYTMNTSLSNNGNLDLMGDSNVVEDKFTIVGDFTGDNGIIDLDMNAMNETSDMILVKGDFTGNQLINPTVYDIETEFDARTINFMEVEGSNNGQVGFVTSSRSSGVITKGRITGSPFEWEISDNDTSNSNEVWSISTVQDIDATLPAAPERPVVTDPTDPSTPEGSTDSGTGGNTGGSTDGGGTSGGGEIVVLPELPGYASLQNIGEDMIHSNVGSLYTRLGDIRRYKAENEGESLTKDKVIQDDDYMELSRDGVTVWTRATAEYLDYEANGDSYGYDGDVYGFDIGTDYTFEISRDTAVVAGLFYGKRYGNFETFTSDEGKYVVAESADIDMDSWSLAAYGTFIYRDNTYLDLVAGYTDYESDIDAPGLNDSVDGDAVWGSAEVGHSFQIGDIWRVEPQLQLTYTEVDFDDSTNDIGTEVEYTSNKQLTGRVGTIISVGLPINEVAQVRPWFGVSVLQEFMDPEDVTYGGRDFETQDIDTYVEYKIGVQLDLNEAVGMYVEGKYQTDYDDYDLYRGTLGVKYSF